MRLIFNRFAYEYKLKQILPHISWHVRTIHALQANSTSRAAIALSRDEKSFYGRKTAENRKSSHDTKAFETESFSMHN